MNDHFDRTSPIFFSVTKEDNSLKIVRKFQWKVDADRFNKNQTESTGVKHFTISTLERQL